MLIQILWIGANLNKKMTKKQITFQEYVLRKIWIAKPRVITYISHNLGEFIVEKKQDLLASSPNVWFLKISIDKRKNSIYLINLYNALIGCGRVKQTITLVFENILIQ